MAEWIIHSGVKLFTATPTDISGCRFHAHYTATADYSETDLLQETIRLHEWYLRDQGYRRAVNNKNPAYNITYQANLLTGGCDVYVETYLEYVSARRGHAGFF